MSVSGNYLGGIETAHPVVLAGTSQTSIYTAPDKSNTLASFALVNTTASPITATCYHYDSTTNHVIYHAQVAANSTTVVSDIPRRLRTGDIFKVTAAANLVVVPTIFVNHINEAAIAPVGHSIAPRG